MSSEWIHTTLGEICHSQGGSIQTGPFGSQLHTSDYTECGTPVVMPTNIGHHGISDAGIARIGRDDVERLSQHRLEIGDIVFSRRGDVTKSALVTANEVGWLCGTGCLKVRTGIPKIASVHSTGHCNTWFILTINGGVYEKKNQTQIHRDGVSPMLGTMAFRVGLQ